MINVLFLCTGNSARSILAEALLNHRGAGRFRAFSAGSQPAGLVREGALRQLRKEGIATKGLRSKSWDEFAQPGGPQMDIILTVCDNAAAEPCPFWPGHPATAHWGLPDPAAVEGGEEAIAHAYVEAFDTLDRRIHRLLDLKTITPEALSEAGSL
ncbi:arsenate reductase ArsC [Terriglobus albidus]|uniref:Arsenate reductase ArsC n=1 Tax=Terriglobus albidus TaxID=1592106 RepID=A0A5B9E677_9BACT|nr:arsenate reductase ArsC [Terriglobus albidus]QEE27783.1 arsenate reductase ArsC [Terriglobus albidus]